MSEPEENAQSTNIKAVGSFVTFILGLWLVFLSIDMVEITSIEFLEELHWWISIGGVSLEVLGIVAIALSLNGFSAAERWTVMLIALTVVIPLTVLSLQEHAFDEISASRYEEIAEQLKRHPLLTNDYRVLLEDNKLLKWEADIITQRAVLIQKEIDREKKKKEEAANLDRAKKLIAETL